MRSVLVLAVACSGALRAVGCSGAAETNGDDALPLPERDPLDAGEAGDATRPPDVDAFVPGDAAPDVSNPCDARAPFTTFAPVLGLSTGGDESTVQLRQDESLAYVTRGATIAFYEHQPDGTWTGGAGVEINAGNSDNGRLMDDFLTAYYNVYLGGGLNAPRIFLTTRATTSGTFGSGGRLELGAQNLEGDREPFVTPDQQVLYFSSTRNGVGGGRLFSARRGAASSWQAPVAVPGAAGAVGGERRPVVTADERILYFASDRVAGGKLNVFMGVRADKASPFVVSEVTELSTTEDEYPSWLSPDLCRLYFASERMGGLGQRDIWLASRKP